MGFRPPPDCPYYHADAHRGREYEECLLIERNPLSLPWTRNVCDTCPVPRLVHTTTCTHLALEGTIVRKLGLFPRMEVFAICTKHQLELVDPRRCPECDAEIAAGPA